MTPQEAETLGLRELKKINAKRDIRQAALTLFARHGYAAVTVEQVAAAAGVSRTPFFKYFPTKEAVLLEPDPQEQKAWREIRESRPADELLWDSLTAVTLGYMELSAAWLEAQKSAKESNPHLARIVHDANRRYERDLQQWVKDRSTPEQHPAAELQLNVALAVIETAFRQWLPGEPMRTLLAKADHYMRLLRPASTTD